MTSDLLQTKIRIPPVIQPIVDRPRLTGELSSAIDHVKLMTVSAPAGYGKTTLLAHWAHASGRARRLVIAQ